MNDSSFLEAGEIYREPRPSLLTVLCVLSFIGSVWTIATAGYIYYTADRTAGLISGTEQPKSATDSMAIAAGRLKKSAFGKKFYTNIVSKFDSRAIRFSAAGNMLSGIITLLGAWLMWKGRKAGYYIYIAGTGVLLLAPFIVYGPTLLAGGIAVSGAFIGLVFIALYTLNYRWLSGQAET